MRDLGSVLVILRLQCDAKGWLCVPPERRRVLGRQRRRSHFIPPRLLALTGLSRNWLIVPQVVDIVQSCSVVNGSPPQCDSRDFIATVCKAKMSISPQQQRVNCSKLLGLPIPEKGNALEDEADDHTHCNVGKAKGEGKQVEMDQTK